MAEFCRCASPTKVENSVLCGKCGISWAAPIGMIGLRRAAGSVGRSTVNAPIPTVLHLPLPTEGAQGLATFENVPGGLCGEVVLSARQLTGDLTTVTCKACMWKMLEVLHGQLGAALVVLAKLSAK
jgi:hypothetical protein